MPSLNRASFIGHIGSKPELRSAAGKQVCSFSVAVNSSKKDAKPLWVRVSVWEKQAENCAQYLDKGRAVYVEGRISLDEWTDKQTGEIKHGISLTANQVVFLGGGGERRESAPASQPVGDAPDPTDDIAF